MKTITRVDVENYTYNQYTDGTVLVLNRYTGTDTNVVVPVIETEEKKGIVFIYNYGSCVIGFVDR